MRIGLGMSIVGGGYAPSVAESVSDLSWDQSADTYSRVAASGVTSMHTGMRRCLLNADGSVNYYLDPDDSTLKATGGAADLTGADGNVMVEIPKFYYRFGKTGDVYTWEISNVAKSGFTLHPAFVKAGVEVDYRYYSAYDACYLDATDSTYKSGLNLDDITSSIDTANDKLASVSGVYPLVGNTIVESRALASNVGTGWHQLDYYLMSAVQLLYLIEYGDFDSQAQIGDGNTRHTSWPASSPTQTDSRANVAGLSNGLGNATGGSDTGTINTNDNGDYMSYRGIENFFGNCLNWSDGVFISPSGELGAYYATNDYRDFSDDTTGKTNIGTATTAGNNYATDISSTSGPVFIPTSISGGSSSTYLADYYYSNTSTSRVLLFGSGANAGAQAGAFFLNAYNAASLSFRGIGARLCF